MALGINILFESSDRKFEGEWEHINGSKSLEGKSNLLQVYDEKALPRNAKYILHEHLTVCGL